MVGGRRCAAGLSPIRSTPAETRYSVASLGLGVSAEWLVGPEEREESIDLKSSE